MKVGTEHRDYTRRNYVCTEKGFVRCRKRARPDACELCGEHEDAAGKLDYHHWDDSNFHWGMWVCWKCHRACEVFERELDRFADKYRNLKKCIESTWDSDFEHRMKELQQIMLRKGKKIGDL